MEIITRSFVEKEYLPGLFGEYKESEVEERDPYKVELDSHLVGFRFFDVDFITDNGKTFTSEPYNYSGWLYFGTRLSYEEIIDIYGDDKEYRILINNMRWNDLKYVCRTFEGRFVPINENDVTYEEFSKQKDKKLK